MRRDHSAPAAASNARTQACRTSVEEIPDGAMRPHRHHRCRGISLVPPLHPARTDVRKGRRKRPRRTPAGDGPSTLLERGCRCHPRRRDDKAGSTSSKYPREQDASRAARSASLARWTEGDGRSPRSGGLPAPASKAGEDEEERPRRRRRRAGTARATRRHRPATAPRAASR